MNAAELREMSNEQLDVELRQAYESLFRLRVQSQTETLNAPSEMKRHRRLIARIKTIRHERGDEAAPAATESAEASK